MSRIWTWFLLYEQEITWYRSCLHDDYWSMHEKTVQKSLLGPRLPSFDDVIKWNHFLRSWPFVRENSPVIGEFPSQRPVTRSFDVFFDLRVNKRLSKQSWGWWFETPPCSLWRNCNDGLTQIRREVINHFHYLMKDVLIHTCRFPMVV